MDDSILILHEMSFVRLIVENADAPALVNADCRTNILLDHCKNSLLGATIEQLEARASEARTNVSRRRVYGDVLSATDRQRYLFVTADLFPPLLLAVARTHRADLFVIMTCLLSGCPHALTCL